MRQLIGRVALTLILSGLAGAYAWAEEHGKPPEKGGEAPKSEKNGPEKGGDAAKSGQPVSIGMYYDMPDMKANLSTNARKPVFLKISLSLQMANEADRAKLDVIVPLLTDVFQTYMRELRVEDLAGSGGMYRLRDELLLRASTIALPVVIKDVLFREMVIR